MKCHKHDYRYFNKKHPCQCAFCGKDKKLKSKWNKMDKITGKIFLRETSIIKKGKKLYIITGILGIPKEIKVKGEHLYTCIGKNSELTFSLDILKTFSQDITEEAKGQTPDGLLLQPIWQI